MRRPAVKGARRDAAAVVTDGGCGAWRTLTVFLQPMHRELGLSACVVEGCLPGGQQSDCCAKGYDVYLVPTLRLAHVKNFSFSFSSLLGCAFPLICLEALVCAFFLWYGRDVAGSFVLL